MFKRLFCNHDYSIISKSVAKPFDTAKLKSAQGDGWLELLQGSTTVLLKCSECSDIKTVKMLGVDAEEVLYV